MQGRACKQAALNRGGCQAQGGTHLLHLVTRIARGHCALLRISSRRAAQLLPAQCRQRCRACGWWDQMIQAAAVLVGTCAPSSTSCHQPMHQSRTWPRAACTGPPPGHPAAGRGGGRRFEMGSRGPKSSDQSQPQVAALTSCRASAEGVQRRGESREWKEAVEAETCACRPSSSVSAHSASGLEACDAASSSAHRSSVLAVLSAPADRSARRRAALPPVLPCTACSPSKAQGRAPQSAPGDAARCRCSGVGSASTRPLVLGPASCCCETLAWMRGSSRTAAGWGAAPGAVRNHGGRQTAALQPCSCPPA